MSLGFCTAAKGQFAKGRFSVPEAAGARRRAAVVVLADEDRAEIEDVLRGASSTDDRGEIGAASETPSHSPP